MFVVGLYLIFLKFNLNIEKFGIIFGYIVTNLLTLWVKIMLF